MIAKASAVTASAPTPVSSPAPDAPVPFMLRPEAAWRILCVRTGARIHLASFYRWLKNGKVYSVRMGYNIFVPRPALENLIKQCLAGERL